MASTATEVEKLIPKEYAAGFYTDIEQDTVAPGLDEDVIRFISAKKEEPQYKCPFPVSIWSWCRDR